MESTLSHSLIKFGQDFIVIISKSVTNNKKTAVIAQTMLMQKDTIWYIW